MAVGSARAKAGRRSWPRRAVPRLVAALLVPVFAPAAHAVDAKASTPEIKLSFDSLGIPPLSQRLLEAGASMLTLNFVDKDHLLVSFGTRDLVPRLVGDPPEDEDRMVAAELLELPSGKVLARTRWHLHDHARYLWPVGEGRFLLKVGGSLSVFAPLANLATSDPFQRAEFPYRAGVLDRVMVSPDSKLLTLATHLAVKKKNTGIDINTLTSDDTPFSKPPEMLDFYRISGSATVESPFRAVLSGVVSAPAPVKLPVDSDGYLVPAGGKRGRWQVDFQSFAGPSRQVGIVDSACTPGLEMVSSTQWLAFACRIAGSDGMTMEAYDFAKHEIWEEPMGSLTTSPVFAYAPAAGRFAMGRKLDFTAQSSSGPYSETTTSQEVRVYGTQTGDLLLKVYGVPVIRTFENFDLSPDGMRLAVVRNNAIEVYRLPELTKLDREDLAELQKLVPPAASGKVDLHRLTTDAGPRIQLSQAAADEALAPPAPSSVPPASSVVGPPLPAASSGAGTPEKTAEATGGQTTPAQASLTGTLSDMEVTPATETRRKPPTLLNPGEKPEMKPKKSETGPQTP